MDEVMFCRRRGKVSLFVVYCEFSDLYNPLQECSLLVILRFCVKMLIGVCVCLNRSVQMCIHTQYRAPLKNSNYWGRQWSILRLHNNYTVKTVFSKLSCL